MEFRDEYQEPFTDLISLDYSDDSTEESTHPSIANKRYNSEAEFQDEINKLKAESTKKFKNKWEQILHKYSQIDDDVQSDEIDLFTGKITIDNGHLRSLQTYIPNKEGMKQNVWDLEYDAERDEQTAKRKEKEELRKKHKLKQALKAEELFLLDSKSKQRVKSPVRKVSPDNILLLDPSPSKKQRISPTKNERFPMDNGSPKFEISDSEDNESPLKVPKLRLPVAEEISDSDEEDELIRTTWMKRKTTDLNSNPFYEPKGLNPATKTKGNDLLFLDKTFQNTPETLDFDDEYLIVDCEPLHLAFSKSIIHSCCFHKCDYTTGNKQLFENHLLHKHRTELFIMGYPISETEIDKRKKEVVTTKMIDTLSQAFPLAHEVPILPLSGDREMFKCKLKIKKGNHQCRREFLTKHELSVHQENYPFECSKKIQVYVCPLLGCGFMTDQGYLSWRQHFIERRHNVKSSPRGKIVNSTIVDDTIPNVALKIHHSLNKKWNNVKETTKQFDIPERSVLKSINQELDELFRSDDD